MYIHIGNNRIISEKKIIGIFNTQTIIFSERNEWITSQISGDCKSVIIDENNHIKLSIVSPYTIMKRTTLDEKEFFWRNKDE